MRRAVIGMQALSAGGLARAPPSRCHIASSSSWMPAPVAAETRKNGRSQLGTPASPAPSTRVLVVDRVDLVRGDDLRLRGQRRLEQLELPPDGVEIVDRVAAASRPTRPPGARAPWCARGAAGTGGRGPGRDARLRSARARRRRRSCGRRSGRTTPRFGVERRERVVGDLRPRRGDARDQRRLAGVRESRPGRRRRAASARGGGP